MCYSVYAKLGYAFRVSVFDCTILIKECVIDINFVEIDLNFV